MIVRIRWLEGIVHGQIAGEIDERHCFFRTMKIDGVDNLVNNLLSYCQCIFRNK